MNSQLNSSLKYPFDALYSKLPETVMLIIFEFEGLAKENNDKFIKMFKKILLSTKYYSLAFRSAHQYHDMLSLRLKSIPGLNYRETYKYILSAEKHILFCYCQQDCCIKFMYDKKNKYVCGCHENKSGGITHIYHINGGKKIYIRSEKTGFCVKIA
jgi:hypothetical protein